MLTAADVGILTCQWLLLSATNCCPLILTAVEVAAKSNQAL